MTAREMWGPAGVRPSCLIPCAKSEPAEVSVVEVQVPRLNRRYSSQIERDLASGREVPRKAIRVRIAAIGKHHERAGRS